MKTSNKYVVLAAMTLTFAACTQEDDFTPQTDGDAVKINATIGRLQTRVAYEDDGGVDLHSIAISLRSEVVFLCTSSEGQCHAARTIYLFDVFIVLYTNNSYH